jgi:hypothetical protein
MSDEERDYFTKFGTFVGFLVSVSVASLFCGISDEIVSICVCVFIFEIWKATDAKKEFDQQVIEYRATGSYQPSKHFIRLGNSSVWIRKDRPSPLEKEISSYETIQFPKRPPELDKEYEEREMRSILKRKLKLKGLLNEDGKTWKDGVDFEVELENERRKRSKRNQKEEICEPNS